MPPVPATLLCDQVGKHMNVRLWLARDASVTRRRRRTQHPLRLWNLTRTHRQMNQRQKRARLPADEVFRCTAERGTSRRLSGTEHAGDRRRIPARASHPHTSTVFSRVLLPPGPVGWASGWRFADPSSSRAVAPLKRRTSWETGPASAFRCPSRRSIVTPITRNLARRLLREASNSSAVPCRPRQTKDATCSFPT